MSDRTADELGIHDLVGRLFQVQLANRLRQRLAANASRLRHEPA